MADNELANNISGGKQADDALYRHVEEMKALNVLSQRIGGSLSLDHIMNVAFEELNNIIAPDLVLLFLRKGEEYALQSMHTRSSDLSYPGSQIKHSGECLCGIAGSEGKSQYSNDIVTDPHCTQEGCRKAGIRSFAALPLLKGEVIIGVVGIASLKPRHFSRQAAFLEASAGVLSLAIQKVLLHQEAERRSAALEEEVAERQRAEQAQFDSETRQAAILRTMQLVLYCAVTPSPFSATWMTDNVKQLTGFPVELFLTEPEFWSSRIHPDDSERVAHAFELIRSKKVMDLEYRWKCADGSYRWFLDRIISIQKEIAGIVEYFGIWLDITERKRQEEALRRSEERFRALFEQAAIGVAHIDTASHRFLKANQKFYDILGYSWEELAQLDFQSITHADDFHSYLENMKLLIEEKIREFTVEKRYHRKDGRVVWVSLTVSPLWAPGEPPVSHIAVLQDVTKRKHAEEALEISEIRHRRLFETAREGILILDADTGQICDVNPFLEKMLGFSRSKLLGKALWEIDLFKDSDSTMSVFRELQTKEHIHYDTILLNTKEGQPKHVEFISSTYMVEDWKVIQCTIRDLTRRKKAARTPRKKR